MLTEKEDDEDKIFNQLIEEGLKNDKKIEHPNDVGHLYVPQMADEISRVRGEKDKVYLQTQQKIREGDFEMI